MKDTTLISRHPDLLESMLDDEVVLMSIERGSYFGLENMARRIWQLIEEPKMKADLVSALAKEYDAKADRIAQDLDGFLQTMLDNGVVILG